MTSLGAQPRTHNGVGPGAPLPCAAPCGGQPWDAERLSALIGDVYDAALDASRWVGVLHKAREFVGGSAAALFSKDACRRSLNVYYDDGGVDPHYKQLYFDTYGKLDPATTGHVYGEIEQPVSTVDLIDYDEFVETRFYKEWAQPQRLVDFTSAVLERSATSAAMFGVFRHERDGLADEQTKRRMRLIVPHIRRAVLIGRVIDLKTAEAATFADTLDGLSAGMFLVEETGRIVHANVSGYAMLDGASVLRAACGKLVATDTNAASALNEIFAMAGGGDAALGTKGIAVPLAALTAAPCRPRASPPARAAAGCAYSAAAARTCTGRRSRASPRRGSSPGPSSSRPPSCACCLPSCSRRRAGDGRRAGIGGRR